MYVPAPADIPDDDPEDTDAPELEHVPEGAADMDAEELDAFVGSLVETIVGETLDKVRAGEVEGLGTTDDDGEVDTEPAVEALGGGPRGFQ